MYAANSAHLQTPELPCIVLHLVPHTIRITNHPTTAVATFGDQQVNKSKAMFETVNMM